MSTSVSSRPYRGIGLTLPALLVMTGLAIIPILAVLQRAVTHGPGELTRLFEMPSFGKVMVNTVVWTVLAVVLALVIGYVAALLLRSRYLRLPGLWRSLLMIPWIIPGVVGATVWRWSLSSDYGVLNHTLQQLGLIDEPVRWLSNPDVVLFAVVMVQVWTTVPFVMLLVSAALTGIPEERYEAARLDGANGLQIFRHIVLPELRPTTGVAALTLVVWALNSFTIIFVMTGGGPASSSTILPILLYQAFNRGDAAMVTTVAVVQLIICAVCAVAYVRSVRDDLEVSR